MYPSANRKRPVAALRAEHVYDMLQKEAEIQNTILDDDWEDTHSKTDILASLIIQDQKEAEQIQTDIGVVDEAKGQVLGTLESEDCS